MAHSSKAVENFPEPGSELALSVGAIADKLLKIIRDKGNRNDSDQHGQLERALAVATEAEQRLAEQSRRIALLETLALADEVTGLMNRRGFDRELNRALAAARRYGDCGVLTLIDLDDFKTINDVYGHPAGDRVLRTIGQLLQLQIRENDSVSRIGGYEFAILLTKCDGDSGITRAEEIEMVLNEHFVNFGARQCWHCQIRPGWRLRRPYLSRRPSHVQEKTPEFVRARPQRPFPAAGPAYG